jgi:hypothetical protein
MTVFTIQKRQYDFTNEVQHIDNMLPIMSM